MAEDHIHHFYPDLHHYHPILHLLMGKRGNLLDTQQQGEGQAMYLSEIHREDYQTGGKKGIRACRIGFRDVMVHKVK